MSRVQGLDWEPLQIWEQGPASTPSTGPLLVSEKKCFFPFYLHYNHLVLRVSSSLFAFLKFSVLDIACVSQQEPRVGSVLQDMNLL